VVPHQPEVAAARAAGIVDHLRRRDVEHAVAVLACAAAKVNVLVVQEVALVEAPKGAERTGVQEHEHAGDPVDLQHAAIDRVIRPHG
jgi:hypothetical protein